MKKRTLSGIIFLLSLLSFAQKTVEATFTEIPPKIDARIDEVWSKAIETEGFYMFQPGDNDPEPEAYKTHIKVLYDNTSLYFLAIMLDPKPETIYKEFSLRDQFSRADFFTIFLNPFLASGNTYFFGVSASGSQVDGIQTNNMDSGWNAEWTSATRITDQGWIAEIAIPYSALRFQNKTETSWGISFARGIMSRNEYYSWTPIDKSKEGDVVQFLGRLKGLHNISPPVRLNFYPYASGKYSYYQGEHQLNYSAGMDVKYGINEQYTLDATLIPDFSDSSVDNKILNLSPFEQYYAEKRPFFTEGMQLFRKGHIFYSRRIGNIPPGYDEISLNENEIFTENPDKVPLINALKISGRSSNGLGIGFLNALTNKTYASVLDTLTGKERQVLSVPLSNYNVAIVDYAFGKNNSIGLANTNLLRRGAFRDANVSALVYDLYTWKNTLNISGTIAMSLIHENSEFTTGYKSYFDISKTYKAHKAGFNLYWVDDIYNQRDMGYMRKNNLVIYDFSYKYRSLKPLGKFNSLSFGADLGLDHIYKPYGIFRKDLEIYGIATDKSQWKYQFETGWISDVIDYYEPHTEGRYYMSPERLYVYAGITSDSRKKFITTVYGSYNYTPNSNEKKHRLGLNEKATLSNRFIVYYSFDLTRHFNDKGFYDLAGEEITFGERDRYELSQSLNFNYYFSVKSALNVQALHNWSKIQYDTLFLLENNGSLGSPISTREGFNYNYWNLDIGYNWEFSPGSKLSLLYRNNILDRNDLYHISYHENLQDMFRRPLLHSFIIKTIYNLDYNRSIRKWF